MQRLLLALALLVSPAAIATALVQPAAAASAALGDLSAYQAIISDTLALAGTGDLTGAEKRLTDFETRWDEATVAMRALDPASWTVIDQAADVALESLRSGTPTKDAVASALTELLASLEPDGATAAAPSTTTTKFSITNPDGSPVPCEVTLKEVRDFNATATPSDQARFDELLNKGIERCNADDDKRADVFFADALALMGH
jgi:hypothetical protein